MSRIKIIILNLCLDLIIIWNLMSCSFNSVSKSIYSCKCDSQSIIKAAYGQILNHPIEYDSKVIEIEGVYRGRFEQSAIFKNKQSNEESNGLWIDFNDADTLRELNTGAILFESQAKIQEIVNKRVKIRGVFDLKSKGHLGQYFGTIKRICYLEVFE